MELPHHIDHLEELIDNFFMFHPDAKYFFIPLKPVATERARTIAHGGKTWSFTPKNTKEFYEDMGWYVASMKPGIILPPYTLGMKFICPRLKTIKEDYPISRAHGDLDNFEKAVLDSLFGKGKIFCDDSNVINVLKCKRLANTEEEVGVHLWVIGMN